MATVTTSIEQDICRQARLRPDKVALRSGRASATYAQLAQRIAWAAGRYRALPGYARGRTVIVAASGQIEFIYAYFGAHVAGLVAAPIDAETNPTRFAYIATALRPLCAIGFDRMETDVARVPLTAFRPDETTADTPLATDGQTATAMADMEGRLDEVADILFTTGTTGAPKGVPLTYRNEAAAARHINAYIGNTPDDIELLALPVSHSFGLGRVRCCLTQGQTLILLGSMVNVKRLMRTIDEEHVTGFTMVPASWHFLQKMSGDRLADFAPQLRYIEMGSAYLSAADKRHLAELFPTTRVTMHYGLTEASRSAFMEFHADAAHLDSVGKASPDTDIAIFGPDGRPLPPGEEGEICVRGEHVTRGYLGLDARGCFYGDGYFRTGDAGTIDSEGYVTLHARIKELINVGAKKVAPTEVDEQIMLMPGVADCACTAAPDPEGVLGEVVEAYVVPAEGATLTAEAITRFLTGRIEGYKIPASYVWATRIPRTQNGKVLRGELAQYRRSE